LKDDPWWRRKMSIHESTGSGQEERDKEKGREEEDARLRTEEKL
jgi:hypothetical protein